jgi:hypothetical protein
MSNTPTPIDPVQLLLAIINSKGGNAADVKNLFNPQMSDLLGMGVPSVTDQQIEQQYMPTWNSVKNAPVGSIEQRIATDIANGLSPFTIKQDIRKANIQLLPGETYGTYDKLVEQLFKEQVDANNKKFERDQTEAKASGGIPKSTEVYDPQQLFPEVFSKLQGNVEKAKSDVSAKLKAMQSAYDASNKTSTPVAGQLPSDEQFRSMAIENLQKYAETKNFPNDTAKKLFIKQNIGHWVNNAKAEFKAMPQIDKMNYYKNIPKTHDQLMKDAAFAYQQELAGAPAKQHIVPNLGGPVTTHESVNLRDPVWQQQQLMGLVSDAMAQQLQQQGKTPRNDALLKMAIAFKQMGK